MTSGVKARCNLFGVLKNMEYLIKNISTAAALIGNKAISIQFIISGCAKANLSFKDGKATLIAGRAKNNLKLGFCSSKHFNNMIEGTALPIPLKGISKISFLKTTFTQLAAILESYLRPSQEALQSKEFFYHSTMMIAYCAFYSLSEIANYDEDAQKIANRVPDGIVVIEIEKKPIVSIHVNNGIFITKDGGVENPHAVLSFKTVDVAYRVLNGKIDSYTAIGLGDISMQGLIPMLENLNPILDLVEKYLK